MSIKSRMACIFSIRGIKNPHMWTFTYADTPAPRDAANRWRCLARELVRGLNMWGVRVFENHPKGHGLHVHLIVSGFYDVNEVRKLSDKYGFGRIHVLEKENPEYVAKYLTKGRRVKGWEGIRLWGCVGAKIYPSWVPSKVKNVKSKTRIGDIYKQLSEILKPKGRIQNFSLIRKARLVEFGVLDYEIIPEKIVTGYRNTPVVGPVCLGRCPSGALDLFNYKLQSVVFISGAPRGVRFFHPKSRYVPELIVEEDRVWVDIRQAVNDFKAKQGIDIG